MKVWVFQILPTPLERPHSCVPLVVTAQAEARACHAERWVAACKIILRIDQPHDELRLGSLDIADEWPKEVQRPLNVTGCLNAPAPVRLSVTFASANARDPAQAL